MARAELTSAKIRVTAGGAPPAMLQTMNFLSKDVRRHRQNAIVASLQRGHAELSGQWEELSWRIKDSFLDGEGIYRIRRTDPYSRSQEVIIGVEAVVVAEERGRGYIDTILAASIARARFFTQYHIAFWTSESAHQIARARIILDVLGDRTSGGRPRRLRATRPSRSDRSQRLEAGSASPEVAREVAIGRKSGDGGPKHGHFAPVLRTGQLMRGAADRDEGHSAIARLKKFYNESATFNRTAAALN